MQHHSHNLIAQRAYFLWISAGKPSGRDVEFWTLAEDAISDDEKLRHKLAHMPARY